MINFFRIVTFLTTLASECTEFVSSRVRHLLSVTTRHIGERSPITVESTYWSRFYRGCGRTFIKFNRLAEDWYASASQTVHSYPAHVAYFLAALLSMGGCLVAIWALRKYGRQRMRGPYALDDQNLSDGSRKRAANNGVYGLLAAFILFQTCAALAVDVNGLYYFIVAGQLLYVIKQFLTHRLREHVYYRTPEVDPHNARAFRFSVVSHKFVARHKPNPSNEHANAAAERNNAATWLNSYGREHGRPLWSLSKSGRDLRENIPGDRGIRCAKDMVSYETTARDPIPARGLVKCMDDLHYLTSGEFNDLLCDAALTQSVIGAYDWTPKAPAFDHYETTGHFDDGKWHFCSGNEDRYEHALWDYTVPTMSAVKVSFSWKLWLIAALTVFIALELVHQYFAPVPLFSAFGYDICLGWHQYHLPYISGLTEVTNFVHGWFTGALVPYDASTDITWLRYISTFPRMGWRVLNASTPPTLHVPYLFDCTATRLYWGLLTLGLIGLTVSLARIKTFHFVVVRKRVSEHRAIMMLKPTVHYGTLMSILTAWTTITTLPRRFEPTARTISSTNEAINDTVVYGLEHTKGQDSGYWLSAAKTRESFFVSRGEVVDLIGLDHVTGKGHIAPGYFCVKAKSKLAPGRAAIAIAYFGQGLDITRSVNYDTPAEDVPYRLRPHMNDLLDAKPSMEMFMGGVIDRGSYHAIHDRTNTEIAVKLRVTDYAQKEPLPARGQPKRDQYAEEFYSHIVGQTAGAEVLDNLDAILEKQKRPGQKVNIDEAKRYMSMLPEAGQERVMDAFLKAEALKKPADPRLITVATATVKLINSLIAYRVTALMKKQLWYAFGVSPIGVAQRIVKIMYGAATATPSDYTRYDATIKEEMRKADRSFLRKLFRPGHHEVVLNNYNRVYGNEVRARTDRGSVKYPQGASQASGDPFTSCLHTARNGLIVYSGLRMSGMSKGEALTFLDEHGIYGGDDGLTSDLPPGVLEAGAELWGVIVKVEVKQRGEHVDFLSRIYGPGVWSGDSDNCAALERALIKFPVTTKIHGIDTRLLAHYKATSAICNDPYTPILGDWAATVGAATARVADSYSDGAKQNTVTAMRLWNLRWCEGNPNLGYQAHMSGTPSWMRDYAAEVMGPAAEGTMKAWSQAVKEGKERWDKPPVLKRQDYKQRDMPYMANGKLIPALNTADDVVVASPAVSSGTPPLGSLPGDRHSGNDVTKTVTPQASPQPVGKAPVRGPMKQDVSSKRPKAKTPTPITTCQWREGDTTCGKAFTAKRIAKGHRLCWKHSGMAYSKRKAATAAPMRGAAVKTP